MISSSINKWKYIVRQNTKYKITLMCYKKYSINLIL